MIINSSTIKRGCLAIRANADMTLGADLTAGSITYEKCCGLARLSYPRLYSLAATK